MRLIAASILLVLTLAASVFMLKCEVSAISG